MSSINQHPTFSYQQPSDYQFSHDSVFFARWLAETLNFEASFSALDLCSGCGVIGLDFLFYLTELNKTLPTQLDFLEVQEIYKDSFLKNQTTLLELKPILTKIKSQLFIQNYEQPHNKKYDLIFSNPPYFFKGHGTLSQSDFKNRCRFFLDSTFESFLTFICKHLNENGVSYFLMRDQLQHGIALDQIFSLFHGIADIVKVTEIRGTSVFKLTKLSNLEKT